jgi:2'-5' RNA ligase
MRLFAAIELPAVAREAVAAEARRVGRRARAATDALRWVRSEHLHLTLVFLGEVVDSTADSVVAAFVAPLEPPAFRIALQGLGAFPAAGRPRTLWLGVGSGSEGVRAVHAAIVARLRACGLDAPDESFHPHVTLGRWKHSAPRDRAAVLAADAQVTIAEFAVTEAVLVRSRLSAEGPTHTVVARSPLSAETNG